MESAGLWGANPQPLHRITAKIPTFLNYNIESYNNHLPGVF